jgi:hypothetical protein
MTRSKLSSKVILLATGIGLSTAAFAGSQPAAAQDTFPAYNVALGACPAGTVYDPIYGCTTAGADDFGYYDYPGGTVLYGRHGHGFGHMGIGADGSIVHHGMGFHHSIVGVGHFGGFGHGMGMGIAGGHNIGGGFGHGMGDVGHGLGFAHAGGFGHGMAGGFHGGGFGGGGHR